MLYWRWTLYVSIMFVVRMGNFVDDMVHKSMPLGGCVIGYDKCQNFDVFKPVRFKDVWEPFQIRSDLLL